MTFEDLIDDKSRDKLNGIIEARKQAEHENWLKRQAIERKYVQDTHFKTAKEMIDWVISGKSMYSEYGYEMKLSDDGKSVGRDGQHSNGFDDCTFWYGWKWQPIDEWIDWVGQISVPEMLEFGYLPCWGRIRKTKWREINNIN